MIFNYFESEKKLLYFEHGADEIPDQIIADYSEKDITHVDFSSNFLISLDCISHFSNLQEIIFDNNFLSDATMFPKKKFPNIVVLSLNNNKFEDLGRLLQNLVRCFPNLRYLSLLGNRLCPALHEDFKVEDYRAYRLSIISRMPKLKFLDATQVDKTDLLPFSAVQEINERPQSPSEHSHKKMERFGSIKKFFGITPKAEVAQSEQPAAYSPLPTDDIENSQSSPQRSAYGKVKNQYEGSQSQGNRFILNQDL